MNNNDNNIIFSFDKEANEVIIKSSLNNVLDEHFLLNNLNKESLMSLITDRVEKLIEKEQLYTIE